jgi:hypothetical protein
MPEQARQKRRRQILSDDNADGPRFDARANENTGIPEDAWVRNFIVRLTRMLRKTGGKT